MAHLIISYAANLVPVGVGTYWVQINSEKDVEDVITDPWILV